MHASYLAFVLSCGCFFCFELLDVAFWLRVRWKRKNEFSWIDRWIYEVISSEESDGACLLSFFLSFHRSLSAVAHKERAYMTRWGLVFDWMFFVHVRYNVYCLHLVSSFSDSCARHFSFKKVLQSMHFILCWYLSSVTRVLLQTADIHHHPFFIVPCFFLPKLPFQLLALNSRAPTGSLIIRLNVCLCHERFCTGYFTALGTGVRASRA